MDKIFDFRVDYFVERNGDLFASLTYKGQSYEIPCLLMGDGTRVFRFLGQLWRK